MLEFIQDPSVGEILLFFILITIFTSIPVYSFKKFHNGEISSPEKGIALALGLGITLAIYRFNGGEYLLEIFGSFAPFFLALAMGLVVAYAIYAIIANIVEQSSGENIKTTWVAVISLIIGVIVFFVVYKSLANSMGVGWLMDYDTRLPIISIVVISALALVFVVILNKSNGGDTNLKVNPTKTEKPPKVDPKDAERKRLVSLAKNLNNKIDSINTTNITEEELNGVITKIFDLYEEANYFNNKEHFITVMKNIKEEDLKTGKENIKQLLHSLKINF
jgi:uncharacterized membrane protein YidH (DUF202 family)